MFLSVIIPCYNQGSYLEKAIASVFVWQKNSIQIIVVNDGSTDNTVSVLECLEKEIDNIVVIHQENKGLSAARNAGIHAASGEWIIFLDADDYLMPKMYEYVSHFVGKNPDIDVIVTGSILIDPSGETLSISCCPDLPINPVCELLKKNWMPVHSVICRRVLFKRFGFFKTKLTALEDWDLWLRFALGGARFGYFDQPCAVYVKYPESMSTDYSLMIKNSRMVLNDAYDTVKNDILLLKCWNDGWNGLRNWFFSFSLLPRTSYLIKNKKYYQAVVLLSKCIYSDPVIFIVIAKCYSIQCIRFVAQYFGLLEKMRSCIKYFNSCK